MPYYTPKGTNKVKEVVNRVGLAIMRRKFKFMKVDIMSSSSSEELIKWVEDQQSDKLTYTFNLELRRIHSTFMVDYPVLPTTLTYYAVILNPNEVQLYTAEDFNRIFTHTQ